MGWDSGWTGRNRGEYMNRSIYGQNRWKMTRSGPFELELHWRRLQVPLMTKEEPREVQVGLKSIMQRSFEWDRLQTGAFDYYSGKQAAGNTMRCFETTTHALKLSIGLRTTHKKREILRNSWYQRETTTENTRLPSRFTKRDYQVKQRPTYRDTESHWAIDNCQEATENHLAKKLSTISWTTENTKHRNQR